MQICYLNFKYLWLGGDNLNELIEEKNDNELYVAFMNGNDNAFNEIIKRLLYLLLLDMLKVLK